MLTSLLLSAAPAVKPAWSTILLYSLLPAAVMIIGAVVAVLRPPGPALRSAILHFAAGVVFSVVAVELLPDIVRQHRPIEVGIGFGLGVAVMLGLRQLTRRLEKKEAGEAESAGGAGEPAPLTVERAGEATPAVTPAATAGALPWGLLVGVGIDIFIDGLLLGIGFAAGAKEGTLLAIALTVELLSLGLATAVELRQDGFGKGRAVGIVAGLALALLLGAGVGTTVLSGATGNLLEIVLSFGLAALLFLVTEELLTEAHEEAESPWLTSAFFVGFLLFLILGMVV
jgi:ZIP family zinc transporter